MKKRIHEQENSSQSAQKTKSKISEQIISSSEPPNKKKKIEGKHLHLIDPSPKWGPKIQIVSQNLKRIPALQRTPLL